MALPRDAARARGLPSGRAAPGSSGSPPLTFVPRRPDPREALGKDNLRGRPDIGRLIFGAVVLFVGIWFLFRNTFGLNLPELDGDMIWPILVVGLGLAILFNTGRRDSHPRT